MSFSPDGRILAASVGKLVRLFDARDGSTVRTIKEPDTPHAGGVGFSPDGTILGTGRMKPNGSTARLWDAATGRVSRKLKTPRQVSTVAFAPRNDLYATSGYGHGVVLWNWKNGERLRVIAPEVQIRFWLSFSPDASRLAAPTVRPHAVRVWNTATGEQEIEYTDFTTFVSATAFSPDGKVLAASSRDGTVRLLDAAKGTYLRRLEYQRVGEGPDDLNALAFSPDGEYLAAGGALHAADGKRKESLLRVWRIKDGGVVGELLGPREERIEGVAASPDGRHVAYARSDGEVGVVRLPRAIRLKQVASE